MPIIYHITQASAWENAQRLGHYTTPSLSSEGFIHCSQREQVLWVAERFYRGQSGLVLLVIATERLSAELRYEESEPGQHFPHLYGPLNLEAVVATYPFDPGPDGLFALPAELQTNDT